MMIESICKSMALCTVTAFWLSACGPSENPSPPKKSDAPTVEKDSETTSESSSVSLINGSEVSEVLKDFFVLSADVQGFEQLNDAQQSELFERFRKGHRNMRCHPSSDNFCRVRFVLEQILLHPSGLSADLRTRLRTYLVQLWVFGSNINSITGQTIRPTFIPGELGAATQIALRNGAAIDLTTAVDAPLDANNIEQLEALLAEIRPYMYMEQRDSDEVDSANDAAAVDSDIQSGFNSTAALEPLESETPALLWVEDANFRTILEKLEQKADYLDKKVREVGGTHSTAPRQPAVPFKVGQVLDYPSTRGALISVGDDLLGLGLGSLESTGTGGEVAHVLWLNLNEAFESKMGAQICREFSPTRSVALNRIERRQLVSVAYHALRDLVGFGADGTENKEPDWLSHRLGENHAILRELRADLAALYVAFDDELHSTGLIPDEKTRDAFLAEYLYSVTEQIGAGADPKQNISLRARLIVLNFLISAGAVSVSATAPGEFRISINDFAALKTPIIQLLGKVRSIRFLGDGVKAGALVDELGFVAVGWTAGMRKRFEKLRFQKYAIVLLPVLERVADSKEQGKRVVQLRQFSTFYDRNLFLASMAKI